MGRVLTLLYHRVRKYKDDPQLLSVDCDTFEEQIDWLKRNYHIVRFDEEWENIDGDAVCITFDDGYQDNFYNAMPICQKYLVPMTIFVSTNAIDTEEELWWYELERNLLISKEYNSKFILTHDLYGTEFRTDDKMMREETYKSLHWLMRDFVNVSTRENWMNQLRDWNHYSKQGRKDNLIMTSEQLKEVDLSIVTVGAHTVNHPRLSILSIDEQRFEIATSKKKLESILGYDIYTFSYPFGAKNDYDDNTVKLCKEMGLHKVAANIPGIWRTGDDNYEIPRHIVRDWNINTFKTAIKSYWREK